MSTNLNSKSPAAQGAAVWEEAETHNKVMKLLKNVRGYMKESQCDYGHCSIWTVDTLSLEELLFIVNRGNREEILFLIHQYGKTTPPERWWSGCNACQRRLTMQHILPAEVQRLIALRGVEQEIDAFIQYHGFGEEGQQIIMDRGNHFELMHYMQRHGFLPHLQKILWERGIREEIILHTTNHGWADEVWQELLQTAVEQNKWSQFEELMMLHEIPVKIQQLFLQVADSDRFFKYINKYGLWNEAHEYLLKYRSEDEIKAYIARHRFLCKIAERHLAQNASTELKLFYIDNRIENEKTSIMTFLQALLKAQPFDRIALAACFSKPSVSTPLCWETESDIDFIRHASHAEIMERIDNGMMGNKSLFALFCRDNDEELNAYVQEWIR